MIDSGADHEKVAALNPHWTVFDWCSYWHRDARKAYRKAGYDYDELIRKDRISPRTITDCGEGCKCQIMTSR